jgi:endogenous inhibitor of DNA gyrase (YacG/DUF329 family)
MAARVAGSPMVVRVLAIVVSGIGGCLCYPDYVNCNCPLRLRQILCSEVMVMRYVSCLVCERVVAYGNTGRLRRFCGRACKQVYYRRQVKARLAAAGVVEEVGGELDSLRRLRAVGRCDDGI